MQSFGHHRLRERHRQAQHELRADREAQRASQHRRRVGPAQHGKREPASQQKRVRAPAALQLGLGEQADRHRQHQRREGGDPEEQGVARRGTRRRSRVEFAPAPPDDKPQPGDERQQAQALHQ